MNRSELRKNIAQALYRATEGLTAREIALLLELNPNKTPHYDCLKMMIEKGEVAKVGMKYYLEDAGIVSYGLLAVALAVAPVIEDEADSCNCQKADNNQVWCEGLSNCRLPHIEESPLSFGVWAFLEEAGNGIVKHFQDTQPKPREIHNRDIKIDVLNDMADRHNPQIANVIKMIIEDLKS